MKVNINFTMVPLYLCTMSEKQQLINLVKAYYIGGIYNNASFPEDYKAYLAKVVDALLEPTLTVVDSKETHATVKYWESKGYLLMPIERETGGWRKFSFVELYWILLLRRLAVVGCSLEIVVPKLINAYEQGYVSNEEIAFNENLGKGFGPDIINGNLVASFFGHIMAVHKSLKGKYSIHIFETSAMFSSEHTMDKANAIETAYATMFKDGIHVSLSDTVFMDNQIEGFKRHLLRKNIFSQQEAEILNLLTRNELKELTVTLHDGKPVKLELTERFNITKEEASKRLIQFLNSPYQEIKAVTNGGKVIAFERTTKKKLE